MRARRLALVALPLLALAACEKGGDDVASSFGVLRDSPVEFDVTTRPPLEMPSEDQLAPPNPNATGPKQPSLREQAEAALEPRLELGTAPVALSPGQEALIKAAGPKPPADIRRLIDRDADARRTARGISNALEFWRPRAEPGETLDAAAEAARLKAAAARGQNPASGPILLLKPANTGLFQGLF